MKRAFLIISILALLNVSCNRNTSGQYIYQSPDNINDGFDIGSLDEVSIDSKYLADAVNAINSGKYKDVHSILIFKDNKLVFEEYFPGYRYKYDGPAHHGEYVDWNKLMPHHIMSATKSITSACIGIAVEKGFIESVHQSIFDYLPKYRHLASGGKEKITIEHLLTMTSGLKWDEWGAPLSSPKNDLIGLWISCNDPIACILERPLVDQPGSSFTYSGGNMVVLGEIIKKATKMSIDTFSEKYLFEPIEIDSSNWVQRFENEVIYAGGGITITPREMAKFGVTFLNNGQWNGIQIISESWIEKSANLFSRNSGINIPGKTSGKHGYSYSWWLNTYKKSGNKINMYSAGGWGGQEIMVVPDLNMVVVFTGGNYTSQVKSFKIFEKYILPAID